MERIKLDFTDNYSLEDKTAEILYVKNLNNTIRFFDDDNGEKWLKYVSDKALFFGSLEVFKINEFIKHKEEFKIFDQIIKVKDLKSLADRIHTGNATYRAYFSELTGIQLGTTNKSTEDALVKSKSTMQIVNKLSEFHPEFVKPKPQEIKQKTKFKIGDSVWTKPYEQTKANISTVESFYVKSGIFLYVIALPNGRKSYLPEFMLTPVTEEGIKVYKAKFSPDELVFMINYPIKFKVLSAEVDQSGQKQTKYSLEAVALATIKEVRTADGELKETKGDKWQVGTVINDINEGLLHTWIEEEPEKTQYLNVGDYVTPNGRSVSNIYRSSLGCQGKVIDVSFGNFDGFLSMDTFIYTIEEFKEQEHYDTITHKIYGKYAAELKKLSPPAFPTGTIVTVREKSDAVKYIVESFKYSYGKYSYNIKKHKDKFSRGWTYSQDYLKLFVKGKKDTAEPKLKMIYLGAVFMLEGVKVEVVESDYDYETKTTTWRIRRVSDKLGKDYTSKQLHDTDLALQLDKKYKQDANSAINS